MTSPTNSWKLASDRSLRPSARSYAHRCESYGVLQAPQPIDSVLGQASSRSHRESKPGPVFAFAVKATYMSPIASEQAVVRSCSIVSRHSSMSTCMKPGPSRARFLRVWCSRLYKDGPVSTQECLRGCSLTRGVCASRSCYCVDSSAPGLVRHWQGYDRAICARGWSQPMVGHYWQGYDQAETTSCISYWQRNAGTGFRRSVVMADGYKTRSDVQCVPRLPHLCSVSYVTLTSPTWLAAN